MKLYMNYPYHMVNYTPWPLTVSIGAMTTTSGMTLWFNKNDMTVCWMGLIIMLLTMIQWWRDIIRESTFQGNHTFNVISSIKISNNFIYCISSIIFRLIFLKNFPQKFITIHWISYNLTP